MERNNKKTETKIKISMEKEEHIFLNIYMRFQVVLLLLMFITVRLFSNFRDKGVIIKKFLLFYCYIDYN